MRSDSPALRRHWIFLPAANLTVRAAGLSLRLGLVLYLSRFLGISEVGQFGLIQGAAGLTPVVLGWGVTYFLGREILGRTPLEAGRLVRDRLLLTMASLIAAGAMVATLIGTGAISAPGGLFWIATILILETIAFDLHLALISIGKPLAANFLLLIRSGLWVVPAAGLGILWPSLRTLDFVLFCWTVALVANFGVLIALVSSWPLAAIARTPVDLSWIFARMRGSKLIYLNDLGIVGMAYLNRYIIDWRLDLHATGLFVLHWAIANAIHVLVTAATVQVSLPTLVAAYRQGGDGGWRIELRALALRVLGIGAPLALLTYAATVHGLPLAVDMPLPIQGKLMALMLVATVIRLLADALNYGLYSRGLDRPLAWINIGGALASVALSLALLPLFGLVGVGMAMLLTALLLLVARAGTLLARSRIGLVEFGHG